MRECLERGLSRVHHRRADNPGQLWNGAKESLTGSDGQHVDPIRVKEIFSGAIAEPAESRQTWIDAACAGNTSLRAAVASLLRLDSQACELDQPLNDRALLGNLSDEDHDVLGAVPAAVGPFAVTGVLGMGTGGIVYQARQHEPERDVAVKVLRVDAPVPRRRFERESQFLAALNHPGIAHVYERGIDLHLGVPYIAMELVGGASPVTDYARERKLGIRDSVELILQACDAVGYAHAVGILHRDLKPANLLVDTSGKLKIVDFGVGQWLASPGTQHGTVVGTFSYASPEQLRGQAGMPGDVYSLGAVLYELVCGRAPIDVDAANMIEAARRIEEETPVTPAKLNRDCKGDLSAVILKSIEKVPSRRYASIAQFADDLRSFLDGRAVTARSESLIDGFRRMIKRRPAVFAAAASLVMASLAWGALTWRQYERSLSAASQLAAAAVKTLDFIESRLGSNPLRQELVDTYVPVAEQFVLARPKDLDARLLLARLYDVKADLYTESQSFQFVRELRERSLSIMTELSAEHPGSVDIAHRCSLAMVRLGDIDRKMSLCDEGSMRYREAFEIQNKLVEAGSADLRLLDDLGWSYLRMADIELNNGKVDSVLTFVDRQIEIARRVEAADRSSSVPYWAMLHAHHQAARVLRDTSRREEYESHARASLASAERLIQISPDERRYLSHFVYRAVEVATDIELPSGQLESAETLAARADACVGTLNRADPGTQDALAAECSVTLLHARIQAQRGRIVEALATAELCLEQSSRLGELGPDGMDSTGFRKLIQMLILDLKSRSSAN
jgi:serine/threonine protein kinase